MRIFDSVLELVGNTPLLEAGNLERGFGLEVRILLKLEYLNPAGSVKDRIAKAMILDARERGLLQEGAVLIEPTSGNTGIGLASMAATLGYRLILTMPETMSVERRNILKAYGAEIVLTDGALGMTGAIDKAKELAREIPNSFIPGQFENPVNPRTHLETTGPGDLEGYRRNDRSVCSGRRYRRDDYRSGPLPEREEPEDSGCGGRTVGFAGTFRREGRST